MVNVARSRSIRSRAFALNSSSAAVAAGWAATDFIERKINPRISGRP